MGVERKGVRGGGGEAGGLRWGWRGRASDGDGEGGG